MYLKLVRVAATARRQPCLSAGCGGGGGSRLSTTANPLTITITRNPVTGIFALMDLPGPVGIDATVQGNDAATVIYVVVTDSAATFAGAPISRTPMREATTPYLPVASGCLSVLFGQVGRVLCADAPARGAWADGPSTTRSR